MLLVTSKEMQALDRMAMDEFCIPSIVLMENAGRGVAELILEDFKDRLSSGVVIIAGPGNNGGDGFVIARRLDEIGVKVKVLTLCETEKFSGDAAVNYRIVRAVGVPVKECHNADALNAERRSLDSAGVIVDAIFGTGLNRGLSGVFAEAVELANASSAPVVSVDMPSGLSGDTGYPLGPVIKAEMTVTMALPKLGQVIYPGINYTGRLKVIDIGVPRAAFDRVGIMAELLDVDRASKTLRPRHPQGHKGTFGHMMVIAGSRGKSGAGVLSAFGALRVGAGLVTVACPAGVQPVIAGMLIEAMTEGLPENSSGEVAFEALDVIKPMLANKKAAVIGPGLGLCREARDLMRDVIKTVPVPMVVDADAITAIGLDHACLADAKGLRVITPHPGEAARLLGCSGADIEKDRVGNAKRLAETTGAVVVLKGARTVIAESGGRYAINTTGNPGMGSGGMGDVLAGVIGGLVAQGYGPWDAACLGVFIHGYAGDRLAQSGAFGYLASELASQIPAVLSEL